MMRKHDAIGGVADSSFASSDLTEIVNRYALSSRIVLTVDNDLSTPTGLHLDYQSIGQLRIARSYVADEVTITTTSTDVYAVATIDVGSLNVQEAGEQWTLTPTLAGLYRPPRAPRHNRIAAQTTMTYVLISRHDLERQLEALIEQYLGGPIDFSPQLPLDGSPTWLRLTRVLADVFEAPNSLVREPIVVEPLREAMINALLYAANHPYAEMLRRKRPPARPRHIKVVIDAIHAEPEYPYTVAALARIGGVSVRSLQEGFRRQVGMPPTAYLRRVRLQRARDDLCHHAGATVAQVAHRWGFTHLGRFAAAYASVYGVKPSLARAPIPYRIQR